MGILDTALQVAGTGLQIAGILGGGSSSSKAAGTNKKYMEQESTYQTDKTITELAKHWQEVDRLVGSQKAIMNKSGVVINSGSADDVVNDTLTQAQLDAEIIQKTGDINVARAEAGVSYYDDLSSQVKTASYINAGATLLTELSKWGTI